MLSAPLAGRALLTQAQENQFEPEQQTICYFPFLQSGPDGDTIICVIGGSALANVTIELYYPDGRPKARERLLLDGQEVMTNALGQFTFPCGANAVRYLRLPGDPRTPVRCWICIRSNNQFVKAFASIPILNRGIVSWLVYRWVLADRFFNFPFPSSCPVIDQKMYIANTTGSASSFFLVPYLPNGERVEVREISIGARNCRTICCAQEFPQLFQGGFLGWFFVQLNFDGVVQSAGIGATGGAFIVP
jgi:hypothetical protein